MSFNLSALAVRERAVTLFFIVLLAVVRRLKPWSNWSGPMGLPSPSETLDGYFRLAGCHCA